MFLLEVFFKIILFSFVSWKLILCLQYQVCCSLCVCVGGGGGGGWRDMEELLDDIQYIITCIIIIGICTHLFNYLFENSLGSQFNLHTTVLSLPTNNQQNIV